MKIVLIHFGLIFFFFCRDRICKGSNSLYYVDPITNEGSCMPAGMQGPCSDHMALVLDKRNGSKGVGVCECDANHFARPMVYHEETQQCYFIFTQVIFDHPIFTDIILKLV